MLQLTETATSTGCADSASTALPGGHKQLEAVTIEEKKEDPARKGWIVVVSLLLISTFFQSFKPTSPYLPHYLQEVHQLTDTFMSNFIYPFRTYAYWLAMIPMAYLAEFVVGYRVALAIGLCSRICEQFLLNYGPSVMALQFAQMLHGVAASTRTIHAAFIFLVMPPQYFHLATSFMRASNFGAQVMAGVIGNCIKDNVDYPYNIMFTISETTVSLGAFSMVLSFAALYFLNKKSPFSASKTKQVAPKIRSWSELKNLFKSIYCTPVCILWSFWWWTAYAVAYLVDDLDSTLFLAVDSNQTKNGYVKSIVSISCVSAALASGACGKFFVRYPFLVLMGGLMLAGTLLIVAAASTSIWLTYGLIIVCSFTFEFTFVACYSFVALRTRKKNRGVALFFNSFISLCFQAGVQYVSMLLGLSVRRKFFVLGCILFLSAAVVFIGSRIFEDTKTPATSALDQDEEDSLSSAVEMTSKCTPPRDPKTSAV